MIEELMARCNALLAQAEALIVHYEEADEEVEKRFAHCCSSPPENLLSEEELTRLDRLEDSVKKALDALSKEPSETQLEKFKEMISDLESTIQELTPPGFAFSN